MGTRYGIRAGKLYWNGYDWVCDPATARYFPSWCEAVLHGLASIRGRMQWDVELCGL